MFTHLIDAASSSIIDNHL